MKKLQLVIKSCDEEIIDLLTSEFVISNVVLAYGQYIYDLNDVIAHRSTISYKLRKILKENGIFWEGDPFDVTATGLLMEVRDRIGGRSPI